MKSDSRRSFVKKSLAASLAASQPAIFSGILKAQGGGGGGGTTDPWDGTVDPGGTTDIGTTGPFDTTDFDGTTVHETTVPPQYEYALKCIEDPSIITYPDWAGTDYADNGYPYGTTAERIHNPAGSDGYLDLLLAGKGPSKGDIGLIFTVNIISKAVKHVVEDNWFLADDQYDIDSFMTSYCQIQLVDSRFPIITVIPTPQMPQGSGGDTDVVSYGVVYPAFLGVAYGVYHDDGTNGITGTIGVEYKGVSLGLSYDKGPEDETIGPIFLPWSIILVRRPFGSSNNADYVPVVPQPQELTRFSAPPPPPNQ